MRTGSIIEANAALSAVLTHADALASASMPKLFGKRASAARLTTLASQAAADADRAATVLLASEGFGLDSIDAIRTAARLVREAPIEAATLREAGISLRNAVDGAQGSYGASIGTDAARAHVDELLAADPATFSRADWRALHSLLEGPHDQFVLRGPRELEGLIPFRQIAAENAVEPYTSTESLNLIRRYFSAWRIADRPIDERVTTARRIVERDPTTISSEDWRTMQRLIESDPTGSVLRGPRKLDGLMPLYDIAGENAVKPYTGAQSIAYLNRYFGAWRVADMPDQQRVALVREFVRRDPTDLNGVEWSKLEALLQADTDATLLRGPQKLDGLVPFHKVAAENAVDPYTGTKIANINRYFTAWRVADMPDQQRVELARGLVARHPSELGPDDWMTLRALVESDPDGVVLRGPRKLDGLLPLNELAGENAVSPYTGAENITYLNRYFTAWRIADMPGEQRLKLASDLVSRHPTELDSTDWTTLQMLLDSDPHGTILRGPRDLDGLLPFQRLAAENAVDPYTSAGSMQNIFSYLVRWRRTLDPEYPQKLAAALDDVAAGQPSNQSRTLVTAEGERLAELVTGRPPDEQAAIALVMLDSSDVAATRGVKGTLELIREGIAGHKGTDANPNVATIRQETLELIDRNLARLAGNHPDGAVRGYVNHPDYAEIGRIRANLGLLDQLDRPPAPDASVSGTDGTMLRW